MTYLFILAFFYYIHAFTQNNSAISHLNNAFTSVCFEEEHDHELVIAKVPSGFFQVTLPPKAAAQCEVLRSTLETKYIIAIILVMMTIKE